MVTHSTVIEALSLLYSLYCIPFSLVYANKIKIWKQPVLDTDAIISHSCTKCAIIEPSKGTSLDSMNITTGVYIQASDRVFE